jgi:hypothetical protein
LKSGTGLTSANIGGPTAAQTLNSGLTAHGTGYQILRMIYSGSLDPKVSYAIRLEDRFYLDNTSANGGLGGDSTSNFAPTVSGTAPNNGLLRINFATVKYTDPSGLYGRVGRFIEQGGPIGLAYSDYFNGGEVGYDKHRVEGFAGYSFNRASNSNLLPETPGSGQSSQSLFAHVGTPLGTKGIVGFNYVNDSAIYSPTTLQNPTTGKIGAVRTPLAVGSFDAGYVFSPLFQVNAEFLHRFGNSPFGGSWTGPNSFWGQGTAGNSTGKLGNSYFDFGYITSGVNSNGPHTEIEGTPDYQQFFLNNPNGYKIAYIGLHHYFATNAQIGLIFQGWGLNGASLPITYTGLTTGTPGFISRDQGQAIFLETRLAF